MKINNIFSIRDVYRKGWTGLDSPELVRSATEILEDAGWIRAIPNDSLGGRPSDRYEVNPRVWQ